MLMLPICHYRIFRYVHSLGRLRYKFITYIPTVTYVNNVSVINVLNTFLFFIFTLYLHVDIMSYVKNYITHIYTYIAKYIC